MQFSLISEYIFPNKKNRKYVPPKDSLETVNIKLHASAAPSMEGKRFFLGVGETLSSKVHRVNYSVGTGRSGAWRFL
jgi:hypothetical protein